MCLESMIPKGEVYGSVDIIRMDCCKKELCLLCASKVRYTDPRCPCCRSDIDKNKVYAGTVVVCLTD